VDLTEPVHAAPAAKALMTLRPRERHEGLLAARQQQATAEWKAEDARRAGIEGTDSQGAEASACVAAATWGWPGPIPRT
jgi:hypothetical protein